MAAGTVDPKPVKPPKVAVAGAEAVTEVAGTDTTDPKEIGLLLSLDGTLKPKEEEGAVDAFGESDLGTLIAATGVAADAAPKLKPVKVAEAEGIVGAGAAKGALPKENPVLPVLAVAALLTAPKLGVDVGIEAVAVTGADTGAPKVKPPKDEDGAGTVLGALKAADVTGVAVAVVVTVAAVFDAPRAVSHDRHFVVPLGFWE